MAVTANATSLGVTIRVGLIGCGNFAQLYHLPALLRDPRAELAIICDPAPSRTTLEVATRANAIVTTEIDALWQRDRCDAVIISTPHALHAELARQALAERRHVLVDKPFVLTSREAGQLSELANRTALVGAVAFNRRLDPGCVRARALISGGCIGMVRHVETMQLGYPSKGWINSPALAGGGPFLGRGAHMADLIPWLIGQRPNRLRSRIWPGPADHVDRGGTIEADFGDFIWVMTSRSDGLYMWDEVRIYGDEGIVELRRPLGQPLGWSLSVIGEGHTETLPAERSEGLATIDFLDATIGLRAPACTFADAWLSVRLIEAAYESATQEGSWITV